MNSFAQRIDDHRVPHSNDSDRRFDGDITSPVIVRTCDHHVHPRAGDRPSDDRAAQVREVPPLLTEGGIVHRGEPIRRVLDEVSRVAPTTTTVLLLGETGVGKERFAQAIHDASPRRRRPMLRVSCAALPATLIESELFGHERGAFTDAISRRIGRFEAANGSTFFLDEIGELSPHMQVRLLRVLQERTIERLGSTEPIKVDIRLIAATNRNLEEAVSHKLFREDLFYRLNVFPITIPPLRERPEDICDLAWTFIDELSGTFDRKITSIAPESLSALQQYSWPGNVRELRNVIERSLIVAKGPTLTLAVPHEKVSACGNTRLVDIETEHIRSMLDRCGWRIRGRNGAAERLGVKPTTLESRMLRLGIHRQKVNSQ